jgi:CHASE2 domain-containing sensor protein/class 3 adenylate cyclase
MDRWILHRPLLASPFVAAFVCLAVWSLERAGLLEQVELQGYDRLVQARGFPPSHPDLAFVDFDDESVQALGVFPIPRAVLAALLERIAQGEPEVIGLDIMLSEKRPAEAEGEAKLAAALASAGNVVLVSNFGSLQLMASEPLPEFRQHALDVAFGNMRLDGDGFVRRMYLGVRTADYTAVSFPVALATNFLQKPLEPAGPGLFRLGPSVIPLDDSGYPVALIGYWSPHPAEVVPSQQVLRADFDPKSLKGKIVIVGMSSSKGQDRFNTPVFRAEGGRKLVSGPEIHAAAVATLLTGQTVGALSPGSRAILSFLLSWAVVLLVIRSRLAYAVVAVALAGVGTYLAARHLFIGYHLWMRFISTEATILLALPAGLAFRFLQERQLKAEAEAEQKELMNLFGRYVSSEVAAEIWRRRGEIVLAGEEKTATVLFSDIRNFTGLTAGKPSAEVLAWLNAYFTAMSEVVHNNGGFLNKFIGDGIMVVFGVPLGSGDRDDACRAVRTGLEMLERVESFNDELGEGRPHIKIGVGIHTGLLTAGNVGSDKRVEYSVIGETVNLASRLESLCKEFKTPLILSPTTEALVREDFETALLGDAPVRGFEGKFNLYSVRAKTSA